MRAKSYLKPAARQQVARPQQPVPLKVHDSPVRAKLGYKEVRELDELPGKIKVLEEEQASITHQLGSPDIYRDFPENAKVLQERFGLIEKELMNYLARWEELEAKRASKGPKI